MAGFNRLAWVCVVAASLSGRVALAQSETSGEARAAEIIIGLPPGSEADVSFAFGDGKVTLELPNGATFPLDFQRDSNGLLRSGEVVPLGDARIRLDLKLASGTVDRVDVSTKQVVVKLRRRFAESSYASVDRDGDYRFGPDDKFQISINGDPKFTQQLVIDPDGRATLPLVGDVALGGLTIREATRTVTELLAQDYLVDPRVDLQIVEYKSRWVMLTGEVGKPGRVALRGGATLKDALADADGLTLGAGDEIVVSRDGAKPGEKIQIPVDRRAFERAEINPALKTGDIVSVPARPYVYVNGEVRLAGKVPLERGMTLMKALSTCGGLTEWASEKGVQIMSEGSSGKMRLYNLKDIRSMRIPDPPLQGGDVIYVKRRFL